MKLKLLLLTICTLSLVKFSPAQNVFDPNDPLITYAAGQFPNSNPENVMRKWGRTQTNVPFNTDRFKAYRFNGMNFRLRYPNNYNPNDRTKRYPVIVFFHGAGEPGLDNEMQLINGAEYFEQKMNANEFNAFMLFPQLPTGFWDYYRFLNVSSILDSVHKYCNTDPDRLIAMGVSNGGLATVFYADLFPQQVATIIAGSPAMVQLAVNNNFSYKHVPIWFASGGLDVNPDTNTVKTFVKPFTDQGGNIRYDIFPGLNHNNVWGPQWAMPYLVPYWKAAHKANPVVLYNKKKFAKESSINVKIGITAGFYQYQWQKDLVDIPGAGSNEITATKFGAYRVRFKRTAQSAWSDWSPDPAVLSPSDGPIAPANLKVVTAGSKSVTLDWDNAAASSGVTGYNVYVNGVKKYTITESTITVADLNPGTTYSFAVEAVDSDGNTSAQATVVSTTTAGNASGLSYRYYKGDWNVLPNFNALTPSKTGNSDNVDIGVRPPGSEEQFGFVWQGYIYIPRAGNYTFSTVSDDGSKLYFNTLYNPDATPLVNNDGLHGWVVVSNNVNVTKAGYYPVAITFFQKTGSKGVSVYWSSADFSWQPIPDAAFSVNAGTAAPTVAAGTGTSLMEQAEVANVSITRAYPNPVSNWLNIDVFNKTENNNINVGIYDLNGKLVFQRNYLQVPYGSNQLKMNISGVRMSPGTYMLKVLANGSPAQVYKLVKVAK